MNDFESRIGVDPIDRLLAEREQLVRFAAELYAKWGPFGSGEARRKSALALAHLQVRSDLDAKEERATEAKVDAMARCHPTYLTFLDAMEDGRARWLMAENDIQSITDRIHRGQSLVRAYASEPR